MINNKAAGMNPAALLYIYVNQIGKIIGKVLVNLVKIWIN